MIQTVVRFRREADEKLMRLLSPKRPQNVRCCAKRNGKIVLFAEFFVIRLGGRIVRRRGGLEDKIHPVVHAERGVKHLRGLAGLARQGYRCAVLIVIQMKGVRVFQPNWSTHPAFGEALIEARDAGVEILALDCRVVPGSVEIDAPVTVDLARPAQVDEC